MESFEMMYAASFVVNPARWAALADRIIGSPQIYGHKEREAEQSVNSVTCHDGFTLNDLVSYNHKHNEDNGENNRDGTDDNRSWNCDIEGPTDDPAIEVHTPPLPANAARWSPRDRYRDIRAAEVAIAPSQRSEFNPT